MILAAMFEDDSYFTSNTVRQVNLCLFSMSKVIDLMVIAITVKDFIQATVTTVTITSN